MKIVNNNWLIMNEISSIIAKMTLRVVGIRPVMCF